MGIRNGAYATVWEAKPGKGNYMDVRLSTSRKNKQTDSYETDFSGWARFIGKANDLGQLSERTRVQLNEVEVTNHYDKEKNQTFWNVAVFDASLCDSNAPKSAQAPEVKNDFMHIPDDIDDDIPFH